MFENVQQIVLKVTKDCNLRCTYCYLRNKNPHKGQTMSYAVFQKLIERITLDKNKVKNKSLNPEKLQIVFHGGEPTLLGAATIEKFINYAKAKIPEVRFSMQTNLTLLDDSWINLLIKHDLHPGISIDGIKNEQNSLRSRNFNFLTKLKLLTKFDIPAGLLMVVSRTNYKSFSSTLAYLKKHKITKMIKANPVENVLENKYAAPELTGKEYFQSVFKPALRKLLKENKLIESNMQFTVNKFVLNFLFDNQAERGQEKTNCGFKFCGGGNHIAEIGPDGNICFCGRWDEDQEINTLGNVHNYTDPFGLSSLQKSINVHLKKIKDIRLKKCDSCEARHICDYGCAAFAYLKYGKIKIREDLYCEFYKKARALLYENRYRTILAYAKACRWPTKLLKNHYQIDIQASNFFKKKEFNDLNLGWDSAAADKNILLIKKDSVKIHI